MPMMLAREECLSRHAGKCSGTPRMLGRGSTSLRSLESGAKFREFDRSRRAGRAGRAGMHKQRAWLWALSPGAGHTDQGQAEGLWTELYGDVAQVTNSRLAECCSAEFPDRSGGRSQAASSSCGHVLAAHTHTHTNSVPTCSRRVHRPKP